MAGAIVSTNKKDYTTPSYIVQKVREFYRRIGSFSGAGITLDPSSNPQSPVKAMISCQLEKPEPIGIDHVREFTENGHEYNWTCAVLQTDGLAYDWKNHFVYDNPPFGRSPNGTTVSHWVMKGIKTRIEAPNTELIYCIPDTPETDLWKNQILLKAQGRCQLKKRVVFGNMFKTKPGSEEFLLDEEGEKIPKKTGIPKPVSLVYFGNYPVDFRQDFQYLGRVENPSEVYSNQKDIRL